MIRSPCYECAGESHDNGGFCKTCDRSFCEECFESSSSGRFNSEYSCEECVYCTGDTEKRKVKADVFVKFLIHLLNIQKNETDLLTLEEAERMCILFMCEKENPT